MPVEWNESLAIGVGVVDRQHRELFARAAEFEAALERSDALAIASTFDFLRSYAVIHFAEEERLMREAAFPGFEEHLAQHRDFTTRLDALVREHREKGPGAFLGLRARNWIVVWLLDHIGVVDQDVGRHLRAHVAARGATGPRP